ncbi:MAG: TetR/AcrR family transcriptional regulator [Acidimicrobiales bacterium]
MASTTSRRGPYAKTEATREAIMQTALEHFALHGFHGASMREIARQAGLSQAGVLHHFKTKDELLIATIDSRDALTAEVVKASISSTSDPLDGMVAVVRDNVTHRQEVQMFVVVSAEASDPSHPAHDYFTRRQTRVVEMLAAQVRRAIEQGAARDGIEPTTVARQCQALMYGLQVQWLLDPSTDMTAIFGEFVDTLRARPTTTRAHRSAPRQ